MIKTHKVLLGMLVLSFGLGAIGTSFSHAGPPLWAGYNRNGERNSNDRADNGRGRRGPVHPAPVNPVFDRGSGPHRGPGRVARGNGLNRRIKDPTWRRNHAGRVVQHPSSRGRWDDEARTVLVHVSREDRCENLGEYLRRVSNRMSIISDLVKRGPSTRFTGPVARGAYERAKEMLANREFWDRLWGRLADMYRQCDLECFDDGEAIGQMSGTGYCSASVELGGLTELDGAALQPKLPICEQAIHIGCLNGYNQAAQDYPGCEVYSTGNYAGLFVQFRSQDCLIDESVTDGQ